MSRRISEGRLGKVEKTLEHRRKLVIRELLRCVSAQPTEVQHSFWRWVRSKIETEKPPDEAELSLCGDRVRYDQWRDGANVDDVLAKVMTAKRHTQMERLFRGYYGH
jgi:hypothetical protein